MTHTPIEANARLLLHDIDQALAHGTQHFNKAGELLPTREAILRTLLVEGEVQLLPAPTSPLEVQ